MIFVHSRVAKLVASLAMLLGLGHRAAHADILYVQAPTGAGAPIISAYWDPDGSDSDQFSWDGFLIPVGANITELRWRGGGAPAGNVTSFDIAIYASIPAGIQPDLGGTGVLRRYHTSSNCGETFAGSAGGTNWYDYHFVFPQPFAAAGNTRYWLYIVAWQAGPPTWGMARASGGNGSHFERVLAAVGDYRFQYGSGDCAFTIVGTPTACSNPTVTQSPIPVNACSGTQASFQVVASGAGTLSYRWRLNGNPVYDGPNGGGHGGGADISGATTDTLTIINPSYWADVGNYDCVVSNTCGPTTSGSAPLAIASWHFTQQPTPLTIAPGGSASFTVAATSSGPLSYQWRKDLIDLSDTAQITGSTTSALTITGATLSDAGSYDCVVSDACSAAACTPAVLTVSCPVDFNSDGAVNPDDLGDFITCYFAEPVCPAADFNTDSNVNPDDLGDFITAYFGSSC